MAWCTSDNFTTARPEEEVASQEVEIFNSPEDVERGVNPFRDCSVNSFRDYPGMESEDNPFNSWMSRVGGRMLATMKAMLYHRPGPSRGHNYTGQAKFLSRALTRDPDIGLSSAPSSHSPVKDADEWCEIILENKKKRRVTDSTKKRILELSKSFSESGIKQQYPWYRRQYLERFKESIRADNEMSRWTRIQQINEHVRDMADEAILNRHPLHDHMLARWAVQKAGELNARSFFTASGTWLRNFKKRHDVGSRKITGYIT